MVAALDEGIGTIVAALDDAKMRRDTLIVFASDNGGPAPGRVTSNGPFRAGKGTLYEGGTRVVACTAWEGHIKPGTVVNAPLHVVDWYPTLLKLAGAALEQDLPLDGRDAWPAIAEGKPSPHTEILLNSTPHNGAIRVGDWKLVLNGNRADDGTSVGGKEEGAKEVAELFNLAEDPSEKHNRAVDQPDKVKELRGRYEALARQAAAPKSTPRPPDYKAPKIWGEPDR
jgi:arylsulfatase A-like enzyme